MAHSLIRIKGSLVNTPHLITEESFNSIMSYVNSRIEGNAEIVSPEMFTEGGGNGAYVDETKMGVMHINGPLTYRTSGWEAMCGGTSYEMLKEQMQEFVATGAKTVVMMADSGGGEAHGMMDSANYIRKLADENEIKLIAYVDGMSASACYGLVSVADEIIMSSDSQVGSIGVLIQLMNNSKALEKAGYERTFITAGKDKVPFAKDGSFTEAFIQRLQDDVDNLYEGFTSHVATHRGLDIQAVKDTEANVFGSAEALKLGLADKVMTVEEFYEYAADVAQTNLKGNTMNPFKLGAKVDQAAMDQIEALQSQLTAESEARALAAASLTDAMANLSKLQEQVVSMTSQLEGFKAEREAAEKAAADAIVAARTAALAEVVPVAEVETYLTNMSAMDEGAFTFMVSQLAATKAARAEGFKAVGEEGAEEEPAASNSVLDTIKAQGIARAKALRA